MRRNEEMEIDYSKLRDSLTYIQEVCNSRGLGQHCCDECPMYNGYECLVSDNSPDNWHIIPKNKSKILC